MLKEHVKAYTLAQAEGSSVTPTKDQYLVPSGLPNPLV